MGLLDYLKQQKDAALNDYQGLLSAYPNANKFMSGLLSNIEAVSPPDPRNLQASQEYAINRAFDIPGGMAGAINVWHGSPHKFDTFDMSKIGTGEGAQAYGHGLYFAENPDTARYYSDAGTKYSYPLQTVIDSHNGDLVKARDGLIQAIESGDNKWMSYLEEIDAAQPNVYKTSLEWPDPAREAADPLGPQHFLDWDKPLSEQPESIRRSLYKLADDNGENYPMLSDAFQPFEVGSTKGSTIHNILSKRGLGESGNRPEAKDVLSQYGIPGIRYLDGGSRGAGEGSYNYVVFDQEIPRIVERNGQGLLNIR